MAYDGELKFDTKIDETGFKIGINSLGSVAKSGMSIITGAVAAASTAISGLAAAAVKTGIEFESAFAGVKKTVTATDEQLASLKDGILDMSERIPESAAGIASVAEAAGQLGIATDDILDFTEVMVNLGTATNLSADEAASSLAKFANITGMSADDYDNLGSTIVALGNNFATTEADIVAMSTRLASAGSVVRLSESQILAVSTALSSVGIEADAGGSAISTLLKNIETAAKSYETASGAIEQTGMTLRDLELFADSNGSDFKALAQELGLTSGELKNYMSNAKDLEKFADVAGVSAQQFVDAWGTDAVSALDMFVTGLSDTERLGKSSVEVLGEMGINEIRLSNAVLALSESGGLLTESVNLANEAWDDNTALANEAAQRYETLESKIKLLKNSASNLGIAVYENVQKPLRNLVDLGMQYIAQISDAFKSGGFDGAAAALGSILGDIVTKAAEFAPRFFALGTNVIKSLVNGVLENKSSIASAATVVITGLIETFATLIPDLIKAGIEIITQIAVGMAKNADELAKTINEGILLIVDAITENADEFVKAATTIILSLVDGLVDNLDELLDAAFKIIDTLCDELLTSENIAKITEAAITIVAKLAQAIIENAGDIVVAVAVGIAQAFDGLTSVFYDFKSEADILSEEQEILGQNIDDNIRRFEEIKDNANRVAAEDLIDLSRTEDLYTELTELADASGYVQEKDWDRINLINNELSQATDVEISMIDGQIQKYDELKKAIENVIAQRRADIFIRANEEAYEEAVLNESNVESELISQYKALEETKAKRDALIKKAKALGINDIMASKDTAGDIMKKNGVDWEEYEKLTNLQAEQKADIIANESLYADYTNTIFDYNNALTANANGKYEKVVEILDKEGQAFVTANDLMGKSTEEQREILLKQVEDAKSHAEFILQQYQNNVAGITEETVNAANQAYDDAVAQYQSINDEFASGIEIGAEAVSVATQDMRDKVAKAAEESGDIIAQFKDSIQAAPVAAAGVGIIANMAQKFNIPMFADGGILRKGHGIVAEAGPELISITSEGVKITPLSSNARNYSVDSLTELPAVTASAVSSFDAFSNKAQGLAFPVPTDTGNIINNIDDHSSNDTYTTEETHYHIYTNAKNASDAHELAEELEFVKSQNNKGRGL